MFLSTIIKNLVATLSYVFILLLFTTLPAKAECEKNESKTECYLKYIMNYTYETLISANAMIIAWISPDDSKLTATLQQEFTDLYDKESKIAESQKKAKETVLSSFFKQSNNTREINSLLTLKYDYQTLLLNQAISPPKEKTSSDKNETPIDVLNKNPANSYINYASGINLIDYYPYGREVTLAGPLVDQKNYQDTFDTITAIKTFNHYILNDLYYPNYEHRKELTDTQKKLIKQATDTEWFKEVVTENIGWVVRQLLIYQSQTYVLLARLIETQEQLLTAQVMNNTLSMAFNKEYTDNLGKKALNPPPKKEEGS